MTRTLVALLVGLFALPSTAAELRTRLHRPSRGLQVRLTPFDIQPRTEREVCQLIELPNAKEVDFRDLTIAMPVGAEYGSHHFAMFLYSGGDDELLEREPFDSAGCVGVGTAFVSPILAFVQRPKQRIRLPKGVGLRLAPQQRLLLNSHYLNGSGEPLNVDVAVNFKEARRRSIRHHALSFQLGTAAINVPAGTTGSASGAWVVPFPMNVVWLSTHSHKHTTSVTVDVARGGAAPEQQIETRDYTEPSVRRYAKPLRVEPGDRIEWTCNYTNTTTNLVRFGVTAEDEMCFAVGFFYLDDDAAPLPPVRGCFGAGGGLVCPFSGSAG
jgi:hypothetical protein